MQHTHTHTHTHTHASQMCVCEYWYTSIERDDCTARYKDVELARRKEAFPLQLVRTAMQNAPPARDFVQAIKARGRRRGAPQQESLKKFVVCVRVFFFCVFVFFFV